MTKQNGRAERLVNLVQSHVDRVLQTAKDPFGGTPLFANGVEASSGTPAKLDTDELRQTAVLSNLASQQNWLKLLVGLSGQRGTASYKEAAESAMRYVLSHHTDANGLIYWGGHSAYDLEKGEITSDKVPHKHELKCHYPDYGLMWDIDPSGTRRYIEAFWNAHVLDWSNLDFTRHVAGYDKRMGKLWQHEYIGTDPFFFGKGLTFHNAGSDLYYAAAMLSKLSGDPAPLEWSKRLARCYVDTRQGDVGISATQFTEKPDAWCDGPTVLGHRVAYQFAPLVPEGHLLYEGAVFIPTPREQRCQLAIGETLGEEGSEFVRWACEEMTAWGRRAYREADNSFIPMLTDGLVIEGLTFDRNGYYGPKGKVIGPMRANTDIFWMYAMGYRISGDEFLWEMARRVAAGLGFGDIGGPRGGFIDFKPASGKGDYRMLHGLMELYRATGRSDYLELAYQTADTLIAKKYRDGWFLDADMPVNLSPFSSYRREAELAAKRARSFEDMVVTNDPLPLALLHLAVCDETGREAPVPRVFK